MSIVISQNLIISAQNGSSLPLTHARIGYQSYLDDAVLTSDNPAISGYPLDNIKNNQTFERFRVDSSFVNVDIDFGVAQNVDYIATVGRNTSTVIVLYSLDGINYQTIDSNTTSTKVAKMFLFEPILARYFRVTYVDSNNVDVANLKIGLSLAMYRPIYGGHSPITLNRQTVVTPTISEGGEFLSSSIRRMGFNSSYDYQHLPAEWYREYFDPFVEHARTGTYYIAWRPEDFPNEVVYGWTSQDFAPSNMGIRDLMQVSWGTGGYDVG